MTGLVLLVAFGATYRLTMLVTHDKLTEEPRLTLLTRLTGHGLHPYADGYDICWCGATFENVELLIGHVAAERGRLSGRRRRVCYLVTCPWCVSQHVGGVVMATGWAFGDRSWWFVPAAALTGSAVTGTWARFARPG